jgi:hypothetical protein
MFWIYAAAVLVVLLVLARFFDRRRGRGSSGPLDRDGYARARDEHARQSLENPSGERGPGI